MTPLSIRDFLDLTTNRRDSMQTHLDSDFDRREFLKHLEARADKLTGEKRTQITAGADGESPLAEWESDGVHCRQMPPDPQGVLRISIGGGDHLPVVVNYCTLRGNRGDCIKLLLKVLKALET